MTPQQFKSLVALTFAASPVGPKVLVSRYNEMLDPHHLNNDLLDKIKSPRDLAALILCCSEMTPTQIAARYNACRPLFETPEYARWLNSPEPYQPTQTE